MEQPDVLKQALREHLRAHIDPATHHPTRRRINLEREGVEDDLCEVVVVPISVNQLLEVVEYFELS